jgi:hypothetical protein
MDGPNPLSALVSMLRARRLRSPNSGGTGAAGVGGFDEILNLVTSGGVAAIPAGPVAEHVQAMARVDPDTLSRDGALAHWLNLYNAGVLDPARRAFDATDETLLRIPGGFSEPLVDVAGRGEDATHRAADQVMVRIAARSAGDRYPAATLASAIRRAATSRYSCSVSYPM